MTDLSFLESCFERCFANDEVSPAARATALAGARPLALARGARLFPPRADDGAAFLITQGVAALFAEQRDGDARAYLMLAGPGDVVERPPRAGGARAAVDFYAWTHVQGVLLNGAATARAASQDAGFADAMRARARESAAGLIDAAVDATMASAELRMARRLLALMNRTNRTRARAASLGKISQSDLAALVGVTRKRINTMLALWFRSGLAFQDRAGAFEILDRRRLEEIAARDDAEADASFWTEQIDHLLDAGLNAPALDLALEALEREPREKIYAHRAALANARIGQAQAALEILPACDRSLAKAPRLGEDICSMRGRILKDIADTAPEDARETAYAEAADAYRTAYEQFGGYYSAVNTAACLALAGDRQGAEAFARTTLEAIGEEAGRSYFAASARAEALLLLGDPAAGDAFVDARLCDDASAAKLGSTRRQIERLTAALGHTPDDVDRIAPATGVVYFAGPLFAAAPDAEEALRGATDDLIAEWHIMSAFGAAAAGSDIVIAETLLARGVELTLVLPTGLSAFKQVSVAPFGADWSTRFDAVVDAALQVVVAPAGAAEDYDAAAVAAMGAARKAAFDLAARPVGLFALRNGPAGAAGLSAASSALWRATLGDDAARTTVIDVPMIDPAPAQGLAVPEERSGEAIRPRAAGAIFLSKDGEAERVEIFPDVYAALEGVEQRRRDGDADKRIVLDCAVDGPPPSTAADFPAAAMGPLLDAGIIAASSHFAAALWLNGEGLTRFTSLGFVRTKQRLQPCHLYGLSNADA